MSNPSDFLPPANGPRQDQLPEQQRNAAGPVPHETARREPQMADTGAPRDWGPRPPTPASAGAVAQPPAAAHPTASAPPPQFSWPDRPRPHSAAHQPAAEWRHEETDKRAPGPPSAEINGPTEQSDNDQDLGGFFTDPPPAQSSPQNNALPATSPKPGSDAPSTSYDGPTHPPDMFVTGYGAPEEHQQVVTSRRRPAGTGWRKMVSKATFGLITPGPSAKQEQTEELVRRIKSALVDVYVVAFVNAKGGVGKTTMTVAAGSAIARERGDRVIAVDVDTDLGNLASRFEQHGGANANIEALSSLQDASSYPTVRVFTVQNDDRLEMLASQSDPRSSFILNSHDFEATMKILRLHYNVILLDCGTAITSPLFTTIAKHVDSLVVVASQDPPGLNGAWATLAWLKAHGFGRLLPRTVVALDATFKGKPMVDINAAETQFREHIPGVNVVRIPYDVHLAEGGDIAFTELKSRTRKALMELAGAVAQHYPARQAHNPRTAKTGRF